MDPWQRPVAPGWAPPPGARPYSQPAIPGYPAPAPVGCGAAVASAVASVIGGAAYAGLGLTSLWAVAYMSRGMGFLAVLLVGGFGLPFVMLTVFSAVVSLGLLIGGLLVLRRRCSGRIICTAAALAAFSTGLIAGVVPLRAVLGHTVWGVSTDALQGWLTFVGLLSAVVVVILVWLPAIRRWCRVRT